MASNRNLKALHDAGVSIWLDTLSRDLLESGHFATLIRDYSVSGATSNPAIFAKAITESDSYDDQIRHLAGANGDLRELFFAIALDDIRIAALELRSVHETSAGRDGFVSFECTPDLANDTDATIAQARDLWQRLGERNVMIKVPATAAGIGAIEQLTRDGINVNVTLLFSVDRYGQVIDAYLRGLTARAAAGEPIDTIASVASFFVSRIDTKVDAHLPDGSPLRGTVAIANARVAYRLFQSRFAGPEWARLHALGANLQRPLWASTGTKDPAYSDVMYVEQLIGGNVINTMPEQTLTAFADHGEIARTVDVRPWDAQETLASAASAGIDLEAVTAELEREGVRSFCSSYEQLLKCIERKLDATAPDVAARTT